MSSSWLKWIGVAVTIGLVGLLVYQSQVETPLPKIEPKKPSDNADATGLKGKNLDSTDSTGPTGAKLASKVLPHPSQRDGFVASAACQSCHQSEYNSWHGSFHRTMTQAASTETVLAPFDNIQLSSRGRDYYLTREGDKFFVTMADPDWEAGAQANGLDLDKVKPPIVKREVVMTTGSHHMQGYWVPSRVSNMLRQVPFVYLLGDKRWVPREDIFIAPPDAERHLAVWNDNCLVCHAVAGNPNFDLQSIKVATEVAELGISCEACHGPGKAHIDFQNNRDIAQLAQDPVINPAKCEPRIASEICGQCHSYFEPYDMQAFAKHGYTYRAGGDLEASHNLVSYDEAKEKGNETAMGSYWTDGTGRLAGREYSGLMESPCFKQGPLTCISCHSSHSSDPNDQLAKDMLTNQACIQCHPKFAKDLSAHTHHASDSSGSLCYNCHMPHTTFGVMKAMRSHRVQTPKIVTQKESDQPNACNLCHLDQTLAWSAEKMEQWYGQPRPTLTDDEIKIAAGALWLLKGDAVQRAVATWHAQWSPALTAATKEWLTPYLAQLLTDDYAVVRYLAGKALDPQLQKLDQKFDYVGAPELLRTASQQVRSQWSKSVAPAADDEASRQQFERVLLDPLTGQLDEAPFKRLLQQQNKRPLFLPE